MKEWWFTEATHKKENNEGTKYDAIEWENKFQLTETGKRLVDIGFLFEIERPHQPRRRLKRSGALFQTEFGKIQPNANLLFERNYKAEEPNDTASSLPVAGQVPLAAPVRIRPPGLWRNRQMGTTGRPNDEQEHRVGPAVFGKIPGNKQASRYNAAWLVGVSKAAPTTACAFSSNTNSDPAARRIVPTASPRPFSLTPQKQTSLQGWLG